MRRIRKDDLVEVIAGKDAGKRGRVLKVDTDRDRLLVEGRNYATKHQRMQQTAGGGMEGGIIQTEAPIHVSNVQPVCPSCDQPTRVGFTLTVEGDSRSKARECRRCNATF